MIVPGDGTPGTGWAIVGERPGQKEARLKRGFVGPSGVILWRLLEVESGGKLARKDCWVTNLDKSYSSGNDDPVVTPEMIEELREELTEVGAKRILAVGRFAARALTGIDEYPIHVMTRNLYPAVGIPGAVVAPCVHPAAALNSGRYDEIKWTQWGIRRWVRGEGGLSETPHDSSIEILRDLDELTEDLWYLDTEGGDDELHSVQISENFLGDRAVVVYAPDFPKLAELLRTRRPALVMHNAPYDINLLASAGIDTSMCRIHDTMVRAWLRGFGAGTDDPLSPAGGPGLLGLKNLVAHYTGVRVKSFKDMAEPTLEARRRLWYRKCHLATLRPGSRIEVSKRGKVKRVITAEGDALALFKRTRSAMRDLAKDKVVNWDTRFSALPAAAKALGLSIAGEWPELSNVARHIPPSVLEPYAAADPVYTKHVFNHLDMDGPAFPPCLETDEACLPIIARMERVGMYVNPASLEAFSAELEERRAKAEETFLSFCGSTLWNPDPPLTINLNSPAQVLEALKNTFPDAFSWISTTAEPVLQGVRAHYAAFHGAEHPVCLTLDALLAHRHAVKQEGTYVEPVREALRTDTVIHPHIRHTVVPSGRYACEKPNLLAWDKECRKVFEARPGHKLGSWDLDQIEARLLAHYSGDPLLLKVFREGLDFHSITAEALLGATIDPATGRAPSELRTPSKVLNYLILYGGGGSVLLRQLEANGIVGKTEEECTRWIREWYKIYPGVKEYAQRAVKEAERQGYVEVPGSGRKRWLPGAYFKNSEIWPFDIYDRAQKQALNHKIQGAAADLIKRAMVRADAELAKLRAAGVWAELLLQIHDELLAEFDEAWEGYVSALMLWALTAESGDYQVEIGATGATGRRWDEVH